MKRLGIRLLALSALSAASLPAQDVAGTWQGTIHLPNRDAREIIKIAKDDSALKATLFSIDLAPGQTFPSAPMSVQGTSVTIQFPGIGATYKATVAADGKSMTGTFTQGQAMGLDLLRATEQTAWEIPSAAARPKAMPPDADPTFAVATIKLSKPDQQGIGIGVQPGGRLSTLNESLVGLISFAYGVQARQIIGAPGWADTDKYDIVAQPDITGIPNDKQIRAMMQKLLANRFELTLHHEKKELPVYAIVSSQVSTKLTPSTGDPNGLPGLGMRALGSISARNAPPVDDSRPDLYTAFQQQLGMKLESTKATVDVLVIDRVEHPSDN